MDAFHCTLGRERSNWKLATDQCERVAKQADRRSVTSGAYRVLRCRGSSPSLREQDILHLLFTVSSGPPVIAMASVHACRCCLHGCSPAVKQRNLDWTPSQESPVVHATDAGVEETSCQLACKPATGPGGEFSFLVFLPCTEDRLAEPSPRFCCSPMITNRTKITDGTRG